MYEETPPTLSFDLGTNLHFEPMNRPAWEKLSDIFVIIGRLDWCNCWFFSYFSWLGFAKRAILALKTIILSFYSNKRSLSLSLYLSVDLFGLLAPQFISSEKHFWAGFVKPEIRALPEPHRGGPPGVQGRGGGASEEPERLEGRSRHQGQDSGLNFFRPWSNTSVVVLRKKAKIEPVRRSGIWRQGLWLGAR